MKTTITRCRVFNFIRFSFGISQAWSRRELYSQLRSWSFSISINWIKLVQSNSLEIRRTNIWMRRIFYIKRSRAKLRICKRSTWFEHIYSWWEATANWDQRGERRTRKTGGSDGDGGGGGGGDTSINSSDSDVLSVPKRRERGTIQS